MRPTWQPITDVTQLVASCWFLVAGFWLLVAGFWLLCCLKAFNKQREPATRNQKPATRNQQPATSNQLRNISYYFSTSRRPGNASRPEKAARAALAELKGIAATIPNESILLDTLPLQEAKDSSAVENIITTHDALLQAEVQVAESHSSKEVQRYAAALRLGVGLVRQYGF